MSNLKEFNGVITNVNTQNYLQQVLGAKKQEFVNNVTALVANDAALQQCEPLSIMYSAIKATALDLPLDKNLGFAYVIPYDNKKKGVKEAQFQMGYKGFVQLAIRSGQFKTINVTEVRKGEIIDTDLLTGEVKLQRLQNRETLSVVGYIAYFRLTNGFEKTLFMSVDDMNLHAMQYSQTFKSSNKYVKENSKWTTDFDAMAKKTVLKLLLNRYAPLSVEMRNAITADKAVIGEKGEEYVDNQIEETQTTEEIAQKAIEQSKETLDIVKKAMQAQEVQVEEVQASQEDLFEAEKGGAI
jgi:recombination protein RecT